MNPLGEQYFPAAFLPAYIHKHPDFGVRRILTYTIFQFLSFTGKEDTTLAPALKKSLFSCEDAFDFSVIERYLSEDDAFAPSFAADSFDPFYLYCAVRMVEDFFDETIASDELSVVDQLIFANHPILCSASFEQADFALDALLQSGAEFYAALYLVLTRYPESLGSLLPAFSEAYREEFHFTCEDFILYGFMNEYFEVEDCMSNASFHTLLDTLVQATLNYYNTDFETLLISDIPSMLRGTASRFSSMKPFGCVTLPYLRGHDDSLFLLQKAFRHTAAYELRNHLFDFHLDEDKLITLDNWKENLRWHYVQYSHVFEPALDVFYATVLSQELLKNSFYRNISELSREA